MMNCFKKLFLQGPSMENREGEWIEPIKHGNDNNTRHVATVAESTMGRKSRASVSVDQKGIRWDDMVSHLDLMGLSDLNLVSPECDDVVMNAVENARKSGVEGSLGRISMGSFFPEDSVMRGLGAKELSLIEEEEEGAGKEMFRAKAKDVLRMTSALKAFSAASSTSAEAGAASPLSSSAAVTRKKTAITSVTALGNGYFLTASRHEAGIEMYKLGEKNEVEFVKKFEGHKKSGVTDIVAFCSKGRFLSAGVGGDVILWDSRCDVVDEDSDDEETGMPLDHVNLLGKFNYFEIQQVAVLDEGSFVRTPHGIDQCSGSFITSSPNETDVQIWSIEKEGKTYDEYANEAYVADMSPIHELEHYAPIESIAAMKDRILTGDVVGDVHVWGRGRRRSSLFGNKSSNKNWTKLHKLTPWKSDIVRTPEEMAEQSVKALCFLGKDTFVSGTKSGTVRVWNDIEVNADVVHKSHASSVKVTGKPVTDIRKLPLIKDPNTAEECMAFSASFADGRMVSMALYLDNPIEEVKNNELVMFHVYRNSSLSSAATAENAGSENAINAIAVLEDCSGSSNNNNNNCSSSSSSNIHKRFPKIS
mmetsp:Transcript_17822/g.37212  ORF Transcript_17822/g.37212 Transcript_17822/m.37212 type:complete len:589 (+) Transcript_17822:198-1964(+)